VPTGQGATTHLTVGRHQAIQEADTATGGCVVSTGITSSSRVDVHALTNDSSQACSVALSAAKAIEPNLSSS
jgi:hypothetical protein